MQPNLTDIKTQGDLGGVKIAMEIDRTAHAHLMSLLTNLYSDPQLAVIREYSTNAWDAHVEAGISKPIEISTPSGLSPYFRVKDYGIGLSLEDIERIYSKYGASTKRSTNEQTGMLGLGCKSALTYTNQFSITAVKNGIKVYVSVSRIEDGTGVMEVINQHPTDEPNGVEISVPAARYNQFGTKCAEFFRYWKPGTVLIDGREPNYVTGKDIGDDILMVSGRGSDVLVMGGVAYPTEDKLYGTTWNDYYFVVNVAIGRVDFTPSREALHYTAQTKATIAKIRGHIKDNLLKTANDDIATAANHAEAIERAVEWENMLGRGSFSFQYKGMTIPSRWDTNFTVYRPYQSRNTTYSGKAYVDYSTLTKSLMVTGYDRENLTSTQKAKLKRYLEDSGLSQSTIYLAEKQIGAPWTDNIETVDWQKILEIKLNTNPRKPRGKVSFEVYNDAGKIDIVDSLPGNKGILYLSPREAPAYDVIQLLTSVFDNDTIVVLPQNRWDKFVRNYPNARHVSKAIAEWVPAQVAKLNDIDKIILGADWHDRNVLTELDASRIDDPELAKFISALSGPQSNDNINAYNRARRLAHPFGIPVEAFRVDSPLAKYPLVGNISRTRTYLNHTYIYINAAYQDRLNS